MMKKVILTVVDESDNFASGFEEKFRKAFNAEMGLKAKNYCVKNIALDFHQPVGIRLNKTLKKYTKCYKLQNIVSATFSSHSDKIILKAMCCKYRPYFKTSGTLDELSEYAFYVGEFPLSNHFIYKDFEADRLIIHDRDLDGEETEDLGQKNNNTLYKKDKIIVQKLSEGYIPTPKDLINVANVDNHVDILGKNIEEAALFTDQAMWNFQDYILEPGVHPLQIPVQPMTVYNPVGSGVLGYAQTNGLAMLAVGFAQSQNDPFGRIIWQFNAAVNRVDMLVEELRKL